MIATGVDTEAEAGDAALERAARGQEPTDEEARALAARPLASLIAAAGLMRDRAKGRLVTYSRKVFIPLTHLCRDECGYCTFRRDPRPGEPLYLEPHEVLEIAEAGRRAGCQEALFSLGDQPERRFPEARDDLRRRGYPSTLAYLAAMSQLVWERTGLLPHSNPGLMGADDLRMLRAANVSLGLMLECASPRLLRGAHWRAPDKVPARRLQCLAAAGEQGIAFTTGILVGIGETETERVESLLAIRALHRRYGHIQEVIVQPFRAKPGTRMAAAPEPLLDELLRALALARLILGGAMNLQSPPNLVREGDCTRLLAAGINDWGGISPVTVDWINPEAAWPQIPRLAAISGAAGFMLRERLAIYPEYAAQPEWVPAPMRARVADWQARRVER